MLLSFLEFNLSDITDRDIEGAYLKLYTMGQGKQGVPTTISASRIIEPWEETKIIYHNLPGYTTEGQTTNESPLLLNEWATWNITDMVIGWLNGTYENYGIQLHTDENHTEVSFFSSDYTGNPSLRPMLEINLGTSSVPEPATMSLLGIGLIGLAWIGRRSDRLMSS